MSGRLARLLDWIDGRLNPIVVKELRQAVRGRFVVAVLILSLLGQTVVVAGFLLTSGINADRLATTPSGAATFTVLFTVLFASTLFFIPIYSGLRMSAERSDSSADLLFITTVRPRTIVVGKMLSIAMLTALIFFSSLPFMVFSYVLRGIDVATILILLAIAFVLVCSQSIGAMFVGCIPASKPFKFVLAGGFVTLTAVIFGPLLRFLMEMVRSTSLMTLMAPAFWRGLTVWLALVLAVDVVLLVLTAALIAPSTANRALPVRAVFALLWLVSLAAAFWYAKQGRDSHLVLVWAIPNAMIAVLVLFSAIGERERWGPRVARTIPSNLPGRAVAFLFYSGGAGGTLWSMLFLASTVGLYQLAVFLFPPRWIEDSSRWYPTWFLHGALALIAYAMTALLLRRTWLRRVPARVTWGIALALFLFFVLIPPLVLFIGYHGTPVFKEYFVFATMLNPFPNTDAAPTPLRTIILGGWAFLAFAANGGWLAAQWRAFRPSPSSALAESDVSTGSLALQEISRP